MDKKGLLVIISSPSGGGKDSVINALLKKISGSARFITTTSRPPRPGNVQGVDYHFITTKEFEDKIKNNEMIEYNIYTGNYYGAEKEKLNKDLQEKKVIFTQIEVNGKHNFDKQGIKHLAIFLKPESLKILRQRITKRGGLDEKTIEQRLKIAESEITKSKDYDYVVTNYEGKLKETIKKVTKIIENSLKNRTK